MNERIAELLAQALQNHYGDPADPILREKAIELVSGWGEKFAELIVRECAAYIDDNIGYDDCNNTYPVGGGELKDHFGVEE
jgi:hypothetical protein